MPRKITVKQLQEQIEEFRFENNEKTKEIHSLSLENSKLRKLNPSLTIKEVVLKSKLEIQIGALERLEQDARQAKYELSTYLRDLITKEKASQG